ncbi:MAG: hypothetical protein KDA41_10295 [Planctomycetales bacterium]|nr:hypothetical protein [Planctomycetales bacterium]
MKGCICGTEIFVPSLDELSDLDFTSDFDAPPYDPTGDVIVFGTAIALAVPAGLVSGLLLVVLGLLMFVCARIWFAAIVLRETGWPRAMLILFVPLLTTLFFFIRFDVAWRPYLLGVLGVITAFVGLLPAMR